MKPAPFTYHDPSTLAEATEILARVENARALAGGQSLLPMMNFRYVMPDHIVDLNGIDGLSYIRIGREIELGAMTRQRDLEFSAELARLCPILAEGLLNVGHRQTRNRGTIGGSLCHLDPSAELAALMMLLDARLEATRSSGGRELPMRDFALGYMTSALEPDELLTRITIPLWADDHGYAFEEFARRHGDFAIASAGVLVSLNDKGDIGRLAVVLSGLGPAPIRLTEIEPQVVGERPADLVVEAVVAVARKAEAFSDAHVTAAYRQHLAGVLCGRALNRAFERALAGRAVHA